MWDKCKCKHVLSITDYLIHTHFLNRWTNHLRSNEDIWTHQSRMFFTHKIYSSCFFYSVRFSLMAAFPSAQVQQLFLHCFPVTSTAASCCQTYFFHIISPIIFFSDSSNHITPRCERPVNEKQTDLQTYILQSVKELQCSTCWSVHAKFVLDYDEVSWFLLAVLYRQDSSTLIAFIRTGNCWCNHLKRSAILLQKDWHLVRLSLEISSPAARIW